MDADTRRRLRGRFDEVAGSYAAGRPSYPEAAVDWLVGGRAVTDVLDLGAGGGALTRALATRAARVVAAEPSRNLLVELRTVSPAISAVESAAERLPFLDASFDAVTVATAFHWFDHDRALPEIARVLRPGGRLGLVWNTREIGESWTRELGELLTSVQPPGLRGDWGTNSVRALDGSVSFSAPEYAKFRHTQRLDLAGLLNLVASRSYVVALEPHVRSSLLSDVTALFDSNADPGGSVEMTYRCQCWRTLSMTNGQSPRQH
jgi:SAM-dependent methyltransferase